MPQKWIPLKFLENEPRQYRIKDREHWQYFYEPIQFKVLDNISFDVSKGEFLTLIGKSGCGKSTLLYVLSTMDTDYEGELEIDGRKLSHCTKDQLAAIRNEKLVLCFSSIICFLNLHASKM